MANSLTLVGLMRVSIGPAIKIMLRGCAASPSSALMLLMFVTAQTHFSALAQPAPGGQHPALLASYVKRPPWKVAGVDHAVGVPPTATLTDWKLLSGPGITVNTTAMPPYVRVDNTSNVVISGVDFSLNGGAAVFCVDSPNLTVTSSKFGGTNLAHAPASIIFADRDSPNFTVSCNTIDGGGNGAGSSLDAEAIWGGSDAANDAVC
jgi:hypothetical protein